MKIIFGLCFSLLSIAIVGQTKSNCSGNYEFKSPIDKNNIQSSVFKLQIAGSYGTGFVIDSENGIFITAAHVLKKYEANKNRDIYCWNGFINKKIKLTFLGNLNESKVDLAILKVSDIKVWREINSKISIKPLDFEFKRPSNSMIDNNYWLFSHQPSGTFEENKKDKSLIYRDITIPKIGQFTYKYYDKNNIGFLINRPSTEGESGSPLLNKYGLVVGVLVESYDQKNKSLVIPSYQVIDLLKFLKKTNRIKSLENKLKKNNPYLDDIRFNFDTQVNSSCISNYELVLWLNNILLEKKTSEENKYILSYIACPIIDVLAARQITDILRQLYTFQKKYAFINAEYLFQEGNVNKIIDSYDAIIGFETAYGNEENITSLYREKIDLYIDKFKLATEELVYSVPNDSVNLFNLETVLDIKKVNEKWKDEITFPQSLLSINQYGKTAAWYITRNPNRNESFNYLVLAEVLNINGYHNLAARAYSKAGYRDRIISMKNYGLINSIELGLESKFNISKEFAELEKDDYFDSTYKQIILKLLGEI